MHGSLLLRAPIIWILLQLASAAFATSSKAAAPQQNRTASSSLDLQDAPLNQATVDWPIDSIHSLRVTKYAAASPERDYFAALISAQSDIFAAYLSSPSPLVKEDEIDFNAYGVNIQIENFDLSLTFAAESKILGAVGAFLQKWKKCEAAWSVIEKGESGGVGIVVSTGMIRRGKSIGTNGTAPWVETA